MTILTKPSIVIKKPDGTKSPLVFDGGESLNEEKVDIYPPVVVEERQPRARRSLGGVLGMALLSTLVVSVGITAGVLLYRQYLRGNALHRYQGFCSIPIESKDLQDAMQMPEPEQDQLIESNYYVQRVMTPQWSNEPFQVLSTASEDSSDGFVVSLREQLDIGDQVEKIRVNDNGRVIQFLHDFNENISGIVDSDRCFVMEIDMENILSPELFVSGIRSGEQFDVTRVRSSLRAALPALRGLARAAALLAPACAGKPTYRLQREDGLIIRKRSADAPSHDYMMFAGKHVQMIEITNLADLLDYEKNRA